MKIVKSSDWLISENKKGGKKFWQLHILCDDNNYYTQTSWYQITATGKESKVQHSEPYFAAPTNEGRANHRDSKAQADFEFDAIIKKQRDKGFRLEHEKSQERPMPMLAHKFSEHSGKLEFPVYVQPKLNGMRMLFDGEVGWSRGNKEVIPAVIQHLLYPCAKKYDTILDGELMLPGNQLLQISMTAIKKFRQDLSPTLIYWVYDIVNKNLTFGERNSLIDEMFGNDIWETPPVNIRRVPTYLCNTEQQVLEYHEKFVSEGFEGTMVRDRLAKYEINKRSYSLLKLKDFTDAEYRIVGITDGDGSDRGLAIFELETDDGKRFNCRPEGTQENRADLFKNREQLIDKYLTVRYFELSKDNIPIFPVGVGIRELGDFS